MEKQGVTQKLGEGVLKDVPKYIEDFQDKLSKRVIKRVKQLKDDNNTTRTSSTN